MIFEGSFWITIGLGVIAAILFQNVNFTFVTKKKSTVANIEAKLLELEAKVNKLIPKDDKKDKGEKKGKDDKKSSASANKQSTNTNSQQGQARRSTNDTVDNTEINNETEPDKSVAQE